MVVAIRLRQHPAFVCSGLLVVSSTLMLGVTPARSAEWSWDRTGDSVALLHGKTTVWRFNHGRNLDVPYFHPVSTVSGTVLSQDQPADHVWHHGLWFCWKFINGVNYWEINRQTGRPDGCTTWSEPRVETGDDRRAVISMELSYGPRQQNGPTVLQERRCLEISAPDAQGRYRIDWSSSFTAGAARVVLDRTPPKEQSWGGYAGLSMRFAEDFAQRQAVSSEGTAKFGAGGRHRSHAPAMDYSAVIEGQAVGLAFLDHPDNPRYPTPWYLIRSSVMSYMNAAILSNQPLTLEAGDDLTLRYRLIIHHDRWDPRDLQRAHAEFADIANPSATE